jgi:TrpR family transcriptional regulator, trp operon repressor
MRKKSWDDFIRLCRHTQSDAKLNELFQLLLTLDEQEQLATRVELLRALLQGDQPQRTIAKTLKISIAKITRGSNALKTISADLRKYLTHNLL